MLRKQQVDIATLSLPEELYRWIGTAPIYESSGESGARTVYIDRDKGVYLKIASKGSLCLSSQLQSYFSKHQMTSPVIQYMSTDRDYLMTEPITGCNGITQKYLEEPEKLSEIFGQSLRRLHEVDAADCLVKDKMSQLILMAESRAFLQSHLDNISSYIGGALALSAAEEIAASKGVLKSDVLLHGDYCLPNIILDHWRFKGFVDVADGGIGDRHYDLAWGLWTLSYNLKSPKYGHRFLDAYGRECVDKKRLRVCGLLAAMA